MHPVGTSSYTPYLQQPSFDLEGMLKKAQTYAEGDDRLLKYINKILNDQKFQSNPRGYLDTWKEKRGYTEEFREPEDQARGFFDTNFRF